MVTEGSARAASSGRPPIRSRRAVGVTPSSAAACARPIGSDVSFGERAEVDAAPRHRREAPLVRAVRREGHHPVRQTKDGFAPVAVVPDRIVVDAARLRRALLEQPVVELRCGGRRRPRHHHVVDTVAHEGRAPYRAVFDAQEVVDAPIELCVAKARADARNPARWRRRSDTRRSTAAAIRPRPAPRRHCAPGLRAPPPPAPRSTGRCCSERRHRGIRLSGLASFGGFCAPPASSPAIGPDGRNVRFSPQAAAPSQPTAPMHRARNHAPRARASRAGLALEPADRADNSCHPVLSAATLGARRSHRATPGLSGAAIFSVSPP
jgi:hypothetical protein